MTSSFTSSTKSILPATVVDTFYFFPLIPIGVFVSCSVNFSSCSPSEKLILPPQLFLINLLRSIDGSVWCWAKSLLGLFGSIEEETLRSCSSEAKKLSWTSPPVCAWIPPHSSYFIIIAWTPQVLTPWVSVLFAEFPLRATLWFYACQILLWLTFGMELCDWMLDLGKFLWVKLIDYKMCTWCSSQTKQPNLAQTIR